MRQTLSAFYIQARIKTKEIFKILSKKRTPVTEQNLNNSFIRKKPFVRRTCIIAKIYPLRHFEPCSKAKTTLIHTSIMD